MHAAWLLAGLVVLGVPGPAVRPGGQAVAAADWSFLRRADPARVRVPVLAIYQAYKPFEAVAADYLISSEQERAALRQEHEATRALYARWQRDLRDGVPTARIVDLPGASLYMFLSHEADVLREIRSFAAPLTRR